MEADLCNAPKVEEDFSTNVKAIAESLYELNLCVRCILRFLKEKTPSAYEGNNSSIAKYIEEEYGLEYILKEQDTEHNNYDTICKGCLGILQNGCDTPIVNKIVDTVQSSGYEFESFTFAISIPLSTMAYQHSLLLHLKEKFSKFYDAVRTADDLPSIKEVIKWVCGPAVGNALGVYFKHESPFKISISFHSEGAEKSLDFLSEVDPSRFTEKKKKKRAPEVPLYSISSIKKALAVLSSAEEMRRFTSCPPDVPVAQCVCQQIVCSHGSLLIGGRYNKYSRCLPQTPWLIDGERLKESSVQEKIINIIGPPIQADDCRFSSSGREDIDVRMLGTGRPFVLEFVNPHRTLLDEDFLSDMQKQINSSTKEIAVSGLQVITKGEYSILKDGETKKTKCYSALIWTKELVPQTELDKLADIKDLRIEQKTPLRVLHRRPLAVRVREVHTMSAQRIDDHHFKLFLKTMAGTYVKEFVHGDFGRTKPNLGTLLGVESDILELDVEVSR
ncbi:tRNA pseudouridine synthase Pus10 isoform X2 [Nematostella vectensis]|uniref:tRNA pseudouridine synthase Pus10 isoform X2 n=1 Tax=Nematostella vectensis TaxID=45351 RepID=UPI002076EE65|nr:tRNA pseudouridine synthase Pus10 isoform X2 [Nematostella vectensis]